MTARGALLALAALTLVVPAAHAALPLAGHYPPGQSGVRGAATPAVGFAYTNFNRLFENGTLRDGGGDDVGTLDEARYANVSMFTWNSGKRVLGMEFGALVGIPFATGPLNDDAGGTQAAHFGLGDVLVTPVSLFGKSDAFDWQFQFTVWSASGRFAPGAPDNRGAGFWSLVYSVGGVHYPGGRRDDWSLSAVARFEEHFEQEGTGITPGSDVVVDYGAAKVLGRFEAGASGYTTWQLTDQEGPPGAEDPGRARSFGLGPELAYTASRTITLRARYHTEFGVRNAIEGDGFWGLVQLRL